MKEERSSARAWLGMALALLAGTAAQARADTPHDGVELTWIVEGAPGCPSESELRESVSQLVKHGDVSANVQAHVRVTMQGSRSFAAEIDTESRGERGHRALEAPTCAELAQGVSAILAWMIDEEVAAPRAPAPVIEPPSPAEEAHTPLRKFRVALAAELATDYGTLPTFALGPSLRAALVFPRWAVAVQLLYLPSRRGEVADSARGAELSLWSAGADACYRLWSFASACAGPELEHVRGEGFGVSSPRKGAATFFAGTFGPDLRVPLLSMLALELRARVVVPFEQQRFALEGVGTVHRMRAAGRGFVGFSLAW